MARVPVSVRRDMVVALGLKLNEIDPMLMIELEALARALDPDYAPEKPWTNPDDADETRTVRRGARR
jgi:hypothetical protein